LNVGTQFLGLTDARATEAGVVIIPVPFDATVCYKAGARDGPARIIEASPHMEFYDEDAGCEGAEWGIYTDIPVDPVLLPDRLASKVEKRVGEWLSRGKLPVVLGGDHSVSIGAIRAVASAYPGLTVVQFDAHTDLRDTYQGTPYSHACVMRRIWDVAKVVQVGIRSTSREEFLFLKEEGREPIWARDVETDFENSLKRLKAYLEPGPVYITIDLDVLDPSVMPAVGTPEPGGLGWYHLVDMVKCVMATAEVVGFDVVELSPLPGLHAADFLAARLVYKVISLLYAKEMSRQVT